jgi:hypothetical protein
MERKTLVTIDSIANTLFMNGDTINGLEINFNEHSTYKTLIRILDICKRRHMSIYMLKDYQFWICFDYDYLKIGGQTISLGVLWLSITFLLLIFSSSTVLFLFVTSLDIHTFKMANLLYNKKSTDA